MCLGCEKAFRIVNRNTCYGSRMCCATVCLSHLNVWYSSILSGLSAARLIHHITTYYFPSSALISFYHRRRAKSGSDSPRPAGRHHTAVVFGCGRNRAAFTVSSAMENRITDETRVNNPFKKFQILTITRGQDLALGDPLTWDSPPWLDRLIWGCQPGPGAILLPSKYI